MAWLTYDGIRFLTHVVIFFKRENTDIHFSLIIYFWLTKILLIWENNQINEHFWLPGASSDLMKATRVATFMVTRAGMSDKVGTHTSH